MAEKYTYADVIIDPEDPRVEIGKEYYCSCYPSGGLNLANMGIGYQELVRVDKDDNSFGPFVVKKDDGIESFPCIIRKKEAKKKYVPFDLTKEEDKARLRWAWLRLKEHSNEVMVKAIYPFIGRVSIDNEEVTTEFLLENYEYLDGTPCGRLVVE